MTLKPALDGSSEAWFGSLLDGHLTKGTRPPGRRGLGPWTREAFAKAIGVGARNTVRNYCIGATLPPAETFSRILSALFGENTYSAERTECVRAYETAAGVEPLPAPFAGVPRPPQYFMGRRDDVAAIRDVLLSAEVFVAVLVRGSPGIGKTALTKALAHDPAIVDRFGDDRWLVELETAATADRMRDAIIRALGCDPSFGFTAALESLHGRQSLLILDNLETPWEPKAERHKTEETLAVLATVPGLALLASFRGKDRISRPDWTLIHTVEKLAPIPAAQLFSRIAGRLISDDPLLSRFIAALDGIPLAIELVAHLAHDEVSLAELWAQWTSIGVDLAVHPDFDAGRLTSLAHSFELSLRSTRVTIAAVRLFSILGQLPSGLALQDRERLLGADSANAGRVLRRIGLAVAGSDARIDLLSPVRDFAGRHYPPTQQDSATWTEHYLALTQRLGGVIGTDQDEGSIARLQLEFANIEAAFRAAIAGDLHERAMAASEGLSRLTCVAALPTGVFAELAIKCRSKDDLLGEAICIRSLGDIALRRSDHEGAQSAFEEAMPLFLRVGSVLGEANCIKRLGDIALRRSDHDWARSAYEEARPLYRRAEEGLGEADCILGMGEIALSCSDYGEALSAYEGALLLYRQIGSVLGEANCIKRLGDIALRRRDYGCAGSAYEEARPLYRRVGSLQGEADCILSIGEIALSRSDHDGARSAYEEAIRLYRRVGDLQGEGNCIKCLGDFALRHSDHDSARSAYEEAIPLYRRVGDSRGEANCIHRLGAIALSRSDHDGARSAFEQAMPLYQRVGSLQGAADCILGLGEIALSRSDHDVARSTFEQALALYRRAGSLQGEGNCTQKLAEIPKH